MSVKLLIEHHLEFLSLKGDCTGSSESTLDKMPHCWKSHVSAHLQYQIYHNKCSKDVSIKTVCTENGKEIKTKENQLRFVLFPF